MNFSKLQMERLRGDLQSMGSNDCINQDQAMAILGSSLPTAIAQNGADAVQTIMESYGFNFSPSEWGAIVSRYPSLAPSRVVDQNWQNHNASAQQFARPVSSDGFTTRS